MDNTISKQSSMQATKMAASQFSTSQSFSSSSFSSMRQSASATMQQSHSFDVEFPAEFKKMSLISGNSTDELMQQFMNAGGQNNALMQQKFESMQGDSSSLIEEMMKSNGDNKTNNQIVLRKNSGSLNPITDVVSTNMGQPTLMDRIMNAKNYDEKKQLFRNNLISPNSEEFNNFFRDRTFSNMMGVSLSRTRATQISNIQVSKTVATKAIRKRIIRKVINGQVMEEEEEIDEIENEPTTEKFVMNNVQNFDNFTVNDIKTGKNLFSVTSGTNVSPSSVQITELKDSELKAIEPPKEKSVKKGFFSSRKKTIDIKNLGRLEPIINELLATEENYVKDLLMIVEEFMPLLERGDAPPEIMGSNRVLLFGNIEIICMFHDVQFLTDLRESEKTPEEVANCFLKHRKEFSLYRHFNRNQPNSELYISKYETYFKQQNNQLGSQGLRNYLIKPTQRLCRYILLMEDLNKECKKHNIQAKEVDETVELLRAEIRLGNDLMALDAIKNCDLDLKDQGDLIFRNSFTIQKGKEPEYNAMVFLFEKMMLFTEIKLENNVDVLYYKDFIFLNDMGLTECPNDAKKFKVWFHKHNVKTYTLRTPDKEIKKKWVNEIRKQLENELQRTKRQKPGRATLIDLKNFSLKSTKK